VRSLAVWGQQAPGMANVQAISRISDAAGTAYRPVHYIAGVCAAMLMVEAMESAGENGGAMTGERIRNGFYARQNWVPRGFDGVCAPSNFTATDHRGTLAVPLYRAPQPQGVEVGFINKLGYMESNDGPYMLAENAKPLDQVGWTSHYDHV
jgi:branched-chain amino acid transport system substrate-binding protein